MQKKMIRAATCALGLLLCLPVVGEQENTPAARKVVRTPHEVTELFHKAEAGDKDAQFELGMVFLGGQGIEREYAEAAKWFAKAAA